jgi:CheY-like chemotaxis protein
MTASDAPLILVVDDTPATRTLMRRLLDRAGMRVLEAESGEAAIRSIERSRPDLVVLDLRLPGISGFDVARWVRANADRGISGTPLLACSASVQPEVQAEARDAGCDDFEGKPFDVPGFAGRIRDLLSRRSQS